MITKGMAAVGLAERAWGQIVHWQRAGKIQGDLTYQEFRRAFEPLFVEALEASPFEELPEAIKTRLCKKHGYYSCIICSKEDGGLR